VGLYINKKGQPNVYKNNDGLSTTNQDYIRRNYFKELLHEQQKTNRELTNTIAELQSQYRQHKKTQSSQWNSVKRQIHYLNVSNQQQTEIDGKILQQLDTLDVKNTDLQQALSEESLLTQSLLNQIERLSESNKEISDRLEKAEVANENLSQQLSEQNVLQKEVIEKIASQSALQNDVVEKLSNQEEFQTEVLKRLDSQEALTEKIFRQINHIRSILFERTNYLATKIEDGYKLTSSYVYKLMTGSEHPLTFTMIKDKKKEEENKLS